MRKTKKGGQLIEPQVIELDTSHSLAANRIHGHRIGLNINGQSRPRRLWLTGLEIHDFND
ncbi:hypothetical protein [uncultured Gimesia sp.]|uniref:hypothetical protein n=1 Tax=uncultured Gimesia sp. TaxID=1678688 RepID=UPI00261111D9|nr:hypothetical protein [uncultured Gimesia sp.]